MNYNNEKYDKGNDAEYIENGLVKLEGKHSFTMFPKFPSILGRGENIYGITSWTVHREIAGHIVTSKDDKIVLCGNFEEEIDPSKIYTIIAKEKVHEKYGRQYELIFIGEIVDFSKIGNQKAFLQTFLTEGQMEEMFKVLENPLETIAKHDKASLKKVKGVGNHIAKCIIERYEQCKDCSKVYIELHEFGLTPKFIQRLIRTYKNPEKIVKIIKENPYQLTFDIDGIGFKTADKIAMQDISFAKSPKRVSAFIYYYLTTISEQGHSFVYANNLTGAIFDEFDGKDEILEVYKNEDGEIVGNNISQAIDDLVKKGILVLEDLEEDMEKSQRRIYIKKYYELEKDIARHLKRLAHAENKFKFSDWQSSLIKQENEQGWAFTDEQKQGIEMTLNNQVSFITGGAGSGKTSVLTGVLGALGVLDGTYTFAQCALAGRAAAKMQEVTGKDGSTIHRLLGFDSSNGGFKHNEKRQLDYDIVILDEISLVGGEIFLSLIKAIPSGSKLIMLGDMGQLESIGSLNLARDLFHSKEVATCELTKIHRQAQKSGIIVASRTIRNGETLFSNSEEGMRVLGELKDMYFDLCQEKDNIKRKVLTHYKEQWENETVKDIMDIQVLCPVKERGDNSVFAMNNLIQEYINPNNGFKAEMKLTTPSDKEFVIRVGDKILNQNNNYELCNLEGMVTDVFNGWTGIVKEINTKEDRVLIYFPIIKDTIEFDRNNVNKSIILGYASTVHKFQGSSAKVIIGVLDNATPPDMRTRELTYTILTRAEELCIMVCQTKALNQSCLKSGIFGKNTFLVELLEDESIKPIIIDLNREYEEYIPREEEANIFN